MLARDVMTSGVVPVNSNSSLAQAVELMVKLKVSGLPVVDDRGLLVGMLTESDLLRRAELGTERKRPRWLEFLLGPGAIAQDYVKTHARRVRRSDDRRRLFGRRGDPSRRRCFADEFAPRQAGPGRPRRPARRHHQPRGPGARVGGDDAGRRRPAQTRRCEHQGDYP